MELLCGMIWHNSPAKSTSLQLVALVSRQNRLTTNVGRTTAMMAWTGVVIVSFSTFGYLIVWSSQKNPLSNGSTDRKRATSTPITRTKQTASVRKKKQANDGQQFAVGAIFSDRGRRTEPIVRPSRLNWLRFWRTQWSTARCYIVFCFTRTLVIEQSRGLARFFFSHIWCDAVSIGEQWPGIWEPSVMFYCCSGLSTSGYLASQSLVNIGSIEWCPVLSISNNFLIEASASFFVTNSRLFQSGLLLGTTPCGGKWEKCVHLVTHHTGGPGSQWF